MAKEISEKEKLEHEKFMEQMAQIVKKGNELDEQFKKQTPEQDQAVFAELAKKWGGADFLNFVSAKFKAVK